MRTILTLLFVVSVTLQGASSLLESKIKAAYLYNFTKFVEWPDSKNTPIRICVVGDPTISRLLSDLSSHQSGKIEFNLVPASEVSAGKCQMLYVAGNEPSPFSFKGTNILTVSDKPDFADMGGIVTLFSDNGKIRFEINLDASRKTDLKISSKLLELGKAR